MFEVQAFQLIWFTGGAPASAAEIYQQIFGTAPDGYQNNRTPSPAVPFLSVANGELENTPVQVVVQPGRVEIAFSPSRGVEVEPNDWGTVPLAQLLPHARRVALQFSHDLGSVARLAVNCHLIDGRPDFKSASAGVVELSGLQFPFDEPLDVMLQVNRRRPSVVLEGVAINRILRIGLGHSQQFVLQQMGPSSQVSPVSVENFAVSVNIDVNNVPLAAPIGLLEQRALMNELISQVEQLAVKPSPEML